MMLSEPKVMAPQVPGQVERCLIALVQVWRALQLYPRSNPVVKGALEKLQAALAAGGPGRPDAAAGLLCEIRADGFYGGENHLGSTRADVARFALQLYHEGAKLLRFEPNATSDDAVAFLEIIGAVLEGKGDARARRKLAQSRIALEFFDEAVIAERGEATQEYEEPDALAYFQAQRQPQQGGEAKPGGHLNDVLTLLVGAERGQEAEKLVLLHTFSDPEKLAETLSFVVHGQEEPDGEAGPRAAHALRQTLSHLQIFMDEFPEALRADMLKNLTEAVLTTDAETRDCIVNAVLPPDIGSGEIADALTAQMPPRMSANVLMRHIQVHDGTASTVQGFLNSLPENKREQVLSRFQESAPSGASAAGAEKQEVIRSLLPQPKPATGGGAAPALSPEAIQERLRVLKERSQQILEVVPEQSAEVRRQVAAESEDIDVQHDVICFFFLYARGDLNEDDRMFRMLQRALQRAMENRQFDFVNQVIQVALGSATAPAREDAFPTLQPYLAPLYEGEAMGAFLHHLVQMAEEEPESGAARGTLEAIAGDATPALFHRLEVEREKQRRFDLLSVFQEIGPIVLDFLRRQVEHPQWFVVRNAVFLMGRLPDEGNVPALATAVGHQDARVRQEALKALGNTPCPNFGEIVAGVLNDAEPGLRAQAAEMLGRLGASAWAPALAERLEGGGWRLRRQPEYALSLMSAMAKIGGQESLAPLQRFLRGTLLPGTLQRPQLRAMGQWALEQIKLRLERGPASGQGRTEAGGEA